MLKNRRSFLPFELARFAHVQIGPISFWEALMSYMLLLGMLLSFSLSAYGLKQLSVTWSAESLALAIFATTVGYIFNYMLLTRASMVDITVAYAACHILILSAIGYFVFNETLSHWHAAGIVFALIAALCVSFASHQ